VRECKSIACACASVRALFLCFRELRLLHVEYAERGKQYVILFIFTLFYEYSKLEYERVPVQYRVQRGGIHYS